VLSSSWSTEPISGPRGQGRFRDLCQGRGGEPARPDHEGRPVPERPQRRVGRRHTGECVEPSYPGGRKRARSAVSRACRTTPPWPGEEAGEPVGSGRREKAVPSHLLYGRVPAGEEQGEPQCSRAPAGGHSREPRSHRPRRAPARTAPPGPGESTGWRAATTTRRPDTRQRRRSRLEGAVGVGEHRSPSVMRAAACCGTSSQSPVLSRRRREPSRAVHAARPTGSPPRPAGAAVVVAPSSPASRGSWAVRSGSRRVRRPRPARDEHRAPGSPVVVGRPLGVVAEDVRARTEQPGGVRDDQGATLS
jgi:hypothetical protein